jgi:hypothetical protein
MSPVVFDVHQTTHRLKNLKRVYLPRSKPGTRDRLYSGSADWPDEAVWKGYALTEQRAPDVFITPESRGLVVALQHLTVAVSGGSNPSRLLRFVGAVAGRHLDILAQLESVKRTVFDAAKVRPVGWIEPPKKGPLKDHVLHAGCVLDAAIELLDQRGADGQELHTRLFEAMRRAYDSVFPPGRGAANPLDEITAPNDRKAFVTDCCLGAVLAHDNGYLPMFELHLRDARVGPLVGFLQHEVSGRDALRRWVEQVHGDVRAQLLVQGADPGAIPVLLPPFANAWMTDKELAEKPDKLHGSVSGYQLLDYFIRSRLSAWAALAPAERWMLLMIAGASIFHGAELPALCAPRLTREDVADRAQLAAALTRIDNPVRRALEAEPDAGLVPQSAQVGGDDAALDAVLGRLNEWIENGTFQTHPEFQRVLGENPSHELQELLRGRGRDFGDHAPAWQARLNRVILESALPGLRSTLDRALARVWDVNPLGLYLYAVDAMQEWVRLTWETTHSNETGPNEEPLQIHTPAGVEAGRLLNQHLGLAEIEGLKAVIGQSPIPKTVIEFFTQAGTGDRTQRVEIRYHELEPRENRFVTRYGSYDYRRITGDFQKDRTIPAAMRLITGCNRVVCILPDVTPDAVDSVIDRLEQVVCEIAGRDALLELAVPSTGPDREERRAVVKPHLEHIDVHWHDKYLAAAVNQLRADLDPVRESLTSVCCPEGTEQP